jgi:nitrogen-specific signal transduction histidine kinase
MMVLSNMDKTHQYHQTVVQNLSYDPQGTTGSSDLFIFKGAISALGERLVVIDILANRAIWFSDHFGHIFPELTTNSSLEEIIEKIGLYEEWMEYLEKIKTSIQVPKNYTYRVQCDQNDTEIIQIDTTYTLIRLNVSTRFESSDCSQPPDREIPFSTLGGIAVSEMVSTIAHEINQPVGTINNLLHGVREQLLTYETHDPELVQAVDKSIEQAQFTADIISRIRDYTHSRQAKVEKIDVNHLIDNCLSLLEFEILNTNVRITHNKLINKALVSGNETMLQQVIVNLIRNSIESMDEDKKIIIITTKREDKFIKISVEDNGKGITIDELNTVFKPFISSKCNGMGIGLNIC